VSRTILIALLALLVGVALGRWLGYEDGRTDQLLTTGVRANVCEELLKSCRSRNERLTASIDSLATSVNHATFSSESAIRLWQECRRDLMFEGEY